VINSAAPDRPDMPRTTSQRPLTSAASDSSLETLPPRHHQRCQLSASLPLIQRQHESSPIYFAVGRQWNAVHDHDSRRPP
jgi:hypothetical protein